MSYLSIPRVHYSGSFIASPSTVNNDITHFDNDNFKPEYQQPQQPGHPNGWWNPLGDHRFTFKCAITALHYADGTEPTPGTDPALSMTVQSLVGGGRPPGKIVDLDPHQQGVSMLWGLEVTIVAAGGSAPLLRATFEPAPFTDIWTRGSTGRGAERAGVMYQSVLQPPAWGDVSSSRFLTELKAASGGGPLSIKFNLDGYSMSQGTTFTKGRIVGTIGAASSDEPRHFVKGRHLSKIDFADEPGFPRPIGGINFCVAVLDEHARKVRLDLGNAMSADPSGGALTDIGNLSLVCDPSGVSPISLGTINYRGPSWYDTTAGLVALPEARTLTDAEIAAIRDKPLSLVTQKTGGAPVIAASENDNGLHVRADMFVARLNPNDKVGITFHATQWGRPQGGATIELQHVDFGPPTNPPIGTPTSALTFPVSATCNAAGQATVTLQASNPGNPRTYIDGQIYMVSYHLTGIDPLNPSDVLSVLVWDSFTPDNPITWHGSMKRIFQQYANLYPFMKAVPGPGIDLGDYQAVSAQFRRIVQTLSLPVTDAHYMPVTRDLSTAKRTAMLAWLNNPGPDGKPLLGSPPQPSARMMAVNATAATKVVSASELAKTRTFRTHD